MSAAVFDRLAAEYDRAWTDSTVGRLQRNAVWREFEKRFRAGQSVLDVGCGTGEDACWLMRRGVRVHAIDASPEMVRIACARGVNAQVARIEDLGRITGTYDGIISNFGALNCVHDFGAVRDAFSRLMPRGGTLAICLMSRFCLNESLHYIGRLRLRKAARRWTGYSYSRTLGLGVHYPSAALISRALQPDFQLVRRIGIGLAVPPSYIRGCSRTALEWRGRFDRLAAHLPFMRSMADHQLFVFLRAGAAE